MRINFREVSTSRTRKGECSVCGKKRTVTRKFFQTVSPFNKNAAGLEKSDVEIRSEIATQAAAWTAEPLVCKGCAS